MSYVVVSPFFLFIVSGCVFPTKVELSNKFSCLANASAAYQAGTVLRTLSSVDADSKKPDDLTFAFLPRDVAVNAGAYTDILQVVMSNANANVTNQFFEKFNVVADAGISGSYEIKAEAKDNTHYIADDSVYYKTLDEIFKANGRLKGDVDYFFIKEAIGSKEVTYSTKIKSNANVSVTLTSDSKLAADITAIDYQNTKTSRRELMVCVVLEKIDVSVVHGADGTQMLAFDKKTASPSEIATIKIKLTNQISIDE